MTVSFKIFQKCQNSNNSLISNILSILDCKTWCSKHELSYHLIAYRFLHWLKWSLWARMFVLQLDLYINSSIWLLCERSTDYFSSSSVSLSLCSPAALFLVRSTILSVTKVLSHFWFLMALSCLWSSLTAFSDILPLPGGLVHAVCP